MIPAGVSWLCSPAHPAVDASPQGLEEETKGVKVKYQRSITIRNIHLRTGNNLSLPVCVEGWFMANENAQQL